MRSIAWFGAVTVSLASLLGGLVGCQSQDQEKTLGPDTRIQKPGMGDARIYFPVLPPDFLAKAGASNARGVFELTVAGEGMDTIVKSWTLEALQSGPTFIADIPVGSPRYFIGRLLSFKTSFDTSPDSARGDTLVRYAGRDSAAIIAGKTADVVLHLWKTNGKGSAKVCVEIEGLPVDSACNAILDTVRIDIVPGTRDTVPEVKDTLQWNGCWSVAYQGLKGHLTAHHDGNLVTGEIEWDTGSRDTLYGTLAFPYLRFTVAGSGNDGQYVGNVLRGFDHFEVKRLGTPNQVVVKLVGNREACTAKPPQDTVITRDSLRCWSVMQSLLNGKSGVGTLAVLGEGGGLDSLWGYFIWDGYTGMPVKGKSSNAGGQEALYLYGNFPAGLGNPDLKVESPAHYKTQIMAGTENLQYGTIYGLSAAGTGGQEMLGKWAGSPVQCPDIALTLIRKMHNR